MISVMLNLKSVQRVVQPALAGFVKLGLSQG